MSTATATTISSSAPRTPRCTASPAAWPCSTASRRACTSTSTTSGNPAIRTTSTWISPISQGHYVGRSVASVGDMTGRRSARHRDRGPAGRLQRRRLRLRVDHQRPPPAHRRLHARRRPAGVCPWIRLRQLTAGQGYRIDGAAAGRSARHVAGRHRRPDGRWHPRSRDRLRGRVAERPRRLRSGRHRARPIAPDDAQPRRHAARPDDLRPRGRRRPRRLDRHRRGRGRQHDRAGRSARRGVLRRRRLPRAHRARDDVRSRAGPVEDRPGRSRRA